MNKLVGATIAIIVLGTIFYYAVVGTLIIKTAEKINKHGLKGIAERIWEGEQK